MGFIDFIFEANSAGSSFEVRVAQAINDWIKSQKLSDKFKACRYQTLSEDDGNRDEDFSDVVVTNLKTDSQFFVECKQSSKDNCVTTQFDISEDDFSVIPVRGRDRTAVPDGSVMYNLAADISENAEYQAFIDFLRSPISTLKTSHCPADLYFNHYDISDNDLMHLIDEYNELVKNDDVESDNKPFKKTLIRESTRNMLAVSLLWRLNDDVNTWDICHIKDIPYFSQLITEHYVDNKAITVDYIQLGKEFLFQLSDQNPFDINCSRFPVDILGQYDLKFTPRFGTGSMYVTPRSKISSQLQSKNSFLDKKRLPDQLG